MDQFVHQFTRFQKTYRKSFCSFTNTYKIYILYPIDLTALPLISSFFSILIQVRLSKGQKWYSELGIGLCKIRAPVRARNKKIIINMQILNLSTFTENFALHHDAKKGKYFFQLFKFLSCRFYHITVFFYVFSPIFYHCGGQ